MKAPKFSFVIPVYNRPDEIRELLESFTNLTSSENYEIVIVEDGSTIDCQEVCNNFKDRLPIHYFAKPNSGPGDSRNYGMRNASGNYFVILDSDCILPKEYLSEVSNFLQKSYVDFYGGPDAADNSFTDVQKAINFVMTSFLTTGGIRGKKGSVAEFEPRSFNMGISKDAFNASGGFGHIHPGEDPDLSIRLKKLGFKSKLIHEAYVYHKRRVDFDKFWKQVYKFGLVRPILNKWHPQSSKFVFWFPSLFVMGLVVAVFLTLGKIYLPIIVYGIYVLMIFVSAIVVTKSLKIAIYSVFAIFLQFFGYGLGFLKSTIALNLMGRNPEKVFPQLFFKHG